MTIDDSFHQKTFWAVLIKIEETQAIFVPDVLAPNFDF